MNKERKKTFKEKNEISRVKKDVNNFRERK